MLKHILIVVSLVQVINCLSIRSNNWLSIDQEYPRQGCSINVDNEDQTLEGKICGYCYAKCQQRFAACLMTQIGHPDEKSVEFCENRLAMCETVCLNDKRVERIAEVKWPMVLQILRNFIDSVSSNGKKH